MLGLRRVPDAPGRRGRAAGLDAADGLAGIRADEEELDIPPARALVHHTDQLAGDLEIGRDGPVQARPRPPERPSRRRVEGLDRAVGGQRRHAPPAEGEALAAGGVDGIGQGRRPHERPGAERPRLEPLPEREEHAVAVEPEAHLPGVGRRHAVEDDVPARLPAGGPGIRVR